MSVRRRVVVVAIGAVVFAACSRAGGPGTADESGGDAGGAPGAGGAAGDAGAVGAGGDGGAAGVGASAGVGGATWGSWGSAALPDFGWAAPLCSPRGDGASGAPADIGRDMAPVVAPDAVAALVAGNAELGLALYRDLGAAAPTSNLFFSPYSISNALALAYVGARGETAQQMASALHFTLDTPTLNAAFDSLDLALSSRAATCDAITLSVVDGLWGDLSLTFDPSYLITLTTYYGTSVQTANFAGAPEVARAAINDWVAVETAHLIPQLLAMGSITPDIRAVLVNALYLDAKWAHPFDASRTKQAPFTRADGSVTSVDMMTDDLRVGHAAGTNWEAVELPYAGGQLSLVILLPAAGHFAEVEGALTGTFTVSVLASMSPATATLSMPKLKFPGRTFSLKTELARLGMMDAFSLAADFSGMTATDQLTIGDVFHQATITIDETGTVAAAATAVVAEPISLITSESPPQIIVDHPYILLIRDRPTGTVLFMGRVLDPQP